MLTYSELMIFIDKEKIDGFKKDIQAFVKNPWKYTDGDRMLRDYILFDYTGNDVDSAEVSMYYGSDALKQGYIKVTNIVPLKKTAECK